MLTAIPVVYADQTYLINKDYQRYHSDIVIHLIEVNVTDKYMGNVYPSKLPEETQWAHLVYTYENIGDKPEMGYLQMSFIDSQGTEYPFNPKGAEYSGEMVQPHSTGGVRWNEVPIPRGTVLAKVHIYEGTNPTFLLKEETFNLQSPTTSSASPSAVPTTTVASTPVTPSQIVNRVCLCFPLLPLVLIGSIAIFGIYARGKGIKK